MPEKISLVAQMKHWHCFDISPVTVVIQGVIYEAAFYKKTYDAPANCQRPGPYTKTGIYCLGLLPKQHNHVCYTLEGDAREWYLAGYFPVIVRGKQDVQACNEYSPLGPNFLLFPYDDTELLPAYRGQKIDHYEEKPYDRVPLYIVKPGEKKVMLRSTPRNRAKYPEFVNRVFAQTPAIGTADVVEVSGPPGGTDGS